MTDPIGTAQERELIEQPYGAGFLKLACPGDQQDEPTWILRFSDRDCREQVFIGKDAEREAWAAWNRYAPSYNCYLFQIASIEAADALQSRIAEVERLTEALTPSAETKYAYLGEFKMPLVRVDECGDEYTEHVTVSWDVIKEIMAAILSRAALSEHRKL